MSKPQGFLIGRDLRRLQTSRCRFRRSSPIGARNCSTRLSASTTDWPDRYARYSAAGAACGLEPSPECLEPVWRGAWPTPGEPLAIVLSGRASSRCNSPSKSLPGCRSPLELRCTERGRQALVPPRFMEPIESNQPDVDHSLERVESSVAEAGSRGIPRNQIALVGFSQGACVVCEYVYRHRVRWGAVVSFTGGLIGAENQRRETQAPGLADTPVLLTNSDSDPWVPLARTQADGGRISWTWRGRAPARISRPAARSH